MEKIEPIFLIKNYDIIFWDFDGVIKESLNAKSEAFKLLFQNESIEVQNFIENHHMNNGGVSRYEKMPIYLNYAGKFFNNDIINDYCDKFSSLVTKNVIESNWVNGVFNFLNKTKILGVGSLIVGDLSNSIIWGSGVIADQIKLEIKPKKILALRGHYSLKKIQEVGGNCEIFGDPVLLFPEFFSNKNV